MTDSTDSTTDAQQAGSRLALAVLAALRSLQPERQPIVAWSHWTLVQPREWDWPHFTPREIASKGDGSLLVDREAMDRLEALRITLDVPIVLASAYRDPLHNAREGGAPRSMHKRGRAFDLVLPPDEWLRRSYRRWVAQQAIRHGFGGQGRYCTFLHVDTGARREWYGNGARGLWR